MTNARCGRAVALTIVGGAVVSLLSSCSEVPDIARFTADPDKGKKERAVMEQMMLVEDAARAFAADHGGKYPAAIDDEFKRHLPAGLSNPFTGKPQQIELGKITDLDALYKSKQPPRVGAGVIQYNVMDDGKVYAIIGGGEKDEAIRDRDNYDRTFILSNIKKYSSDANNLRESWKESD